MSPDFQTNGAAPGHHVSKVGLLLVLGKQLVHRLQVFLQIPLVGEGLFPLTSWDAAFEGGRVSQYMLLKHDLRGENLARIASRFGATLGLPQMVISDVSAECFGEFEPPVATIILTW